MSFFQSKKFQVISLTIGKGTNSLISLAVGMIMARLLSKEDVAAYNQTLLAYMTAAPLLAMGIGNGLYFFLPIEEKRPRGRVFDAMMALGAAAILFSIFIAVGGNDILASRFSNPKVSRMVIWMIPYALFTIPASQYATVLIARGKAGVSAVVSVLSGLFVGVATVLPLLLWHSEEYALLGRVLAACVTAVYGAVLMIRATPKSDSDCPTWSSIRELVFFSVPLGLASMIETVALQLDKFIVGFMCSPEEFAVFNFGAKELPLLGMVTSSITAVIMADLRKAVKAGDYQLAANLFRDCAEKSSLIVFPVVAIVIFGADHLVSWMYGKGYEGAASPMRVYALSLLCRVVVFGAFMTALGQNRLILLRSILALIMNILLSVPTVYIFGPIGAAWSTVAVVLFFVVPYCLVSISRAINLPIRDFIPVRLLYLRLLVIVVPALIYYSVF